MQTKNWNNKSPGAFVSVSMLFSKPYTSPFHLNFKPHSEVVDSKPSDSLFAIGFWLIVLLTGEFEIARLFY